MALAPEDIERALDGFGPRNRSNLIGHGEVERRLLALWNSKRLPHAILLAGPQGIGKATLAYRFARFVLCQEAETGGEGLFGAAPAPTSLDIAPSHPVHRRMVSRSHADLMVVEREWDPEKKRLRPVIRASVARELPGFFAKTAAEGAWRVAVVDPIESLNTQAANALLKILEEPPARALLVLVCHAPGSVLPTIRSRCHRLDLRPLAEDDVARLMAEEAPELAEADRREAARVAEGRPGYAIKLAEDDGKGLALHRELTRHLLALPELDLKGLHALGDRLARDNAAFALVGELLLAWLQKMIRAGATGRAEGAEEGAAMLRLAGALRLDRWIEVWEKVARLFERADAVYLDKKQVLVAGFDILGRAARGET
ncbi:MAG: DNA polymerase III subunit delta' [Alphaproteobacteria bacterium]|nr:DNA polymerase III subunit delta' [Alphaproteobacteria bacterium]